MVDRLGPSGVTYTPDREEAVAAVDRGEAEAAFLLRPTQIADVWAFARRGDVQVWSQLAQPYLKSVAILYCPSFSEEILKQNASRSECDGPDVLAWFPVKGQPVAAKGVTLDGKLSCITRPGGMMQATYNGYPLYTFGSDSAPGMTNGNGSGGAWHVIREKAPAATSAPGSGY